MMPLGGVGGQARGSERGGAVNLGVPVPPSDLLDRHAGRVLRPAYAVLAPGSRPPSATAYRANTLLIPDALLRHNGTREAIISALYPVGLTIEVPPRIDETLPVPPHWLPELRDLPRAVVLRVREGAQPSLVDAWVALQALRAAASQIVTVKGPTADGADTAPDTAAAESETVLTDIVSQITLDHLLRSGASIAGEPGSIEGGSDDTQVAAAGAQFRATSRIPVRPLSPAPPRTPFNELPASRRPVVAVLDTGVRRHPWLGEPDLAPDPFLVTDDAIQAAIEAEAMLVRMFSGLDTPVLTGHHDERDETGPTAGLLDRDIGHGTFIAGVIRQLAPDARVRMIRVMHTDGFVQENVLVLALRLLRVQVAAAAEHGGDAVADVISLSLGYFDENTHDVHYTSHIAKEIKRLNELGVAVVASAGNDATVQPCFPAALAVAPGANPLPVVSVGALNPNGTKAMFSNDGPWVTAWAVGSDVISSYPVDLNGSQQPMAAPSPPYSRLALHRETLDPDGFRGGFAVWSGTSFAAPTVAASLAAMLLELAAENSTEPDYDLANLNAVAAQVRMVHAFKRIGL
jgi:hypothetical protein